MGRRATASMTRRDAAAVVTPSRTRTCTATTATSTRRRQRGASAAPCRHRRHCCCRQDCARTPHAPRRGARATRQRGPPASPSTVAATLCALVSGTSCAPVRAAATARAAAGHDQRCHLLQLPRALPSATGCAGAPAARSLGGPAAAALWLHAQASMLLPPPPAPPSLHRRAAATEGLRGQLPQLAAAAPARPAAGAAGGRR